MQHNYIEEIKKTIEEKNSKSTLFVLKGYEMEDFGCAKSDLAEVIDDNLGRLVSLAMEPVKIISFEEFVCLYEMATRQFKNIVIFENPEYENFYPVNVKLSDEIQASLLTHFDDEANENAELIDSAVLDNYIYVFSNFVATEDGIRCCYNIEPYQLSDEKIEICVIGEVQEKPVITVAKKYNYDEVISYPEIKTYMEQYWGYKDFRDIKIYDMDALEAGEKKVVTISQEKIIGDMISQTEACVKGEGARDIFVTAPTGAGKSLMFQLPAMYLAEKYNLLTIVITPLIGLMNDQVQALNDKGYYGARTINSDISPIIKDEILNEVATGECNILYLSPESLLSRSDITQLIGTRRIGMIIVDEAHIVTTWGKQFRPDYWYLGDHINKLRTTQGKAEENPMSFVIATFTATAIYGGHEDMYNETLNSLHMIDPISYLGYLKRDNISIEIGEVEAVRNRTEYELDKFDALVSMLRASLMRGQKALVYFPTVALIERFYTYCYKENLQDHVAKYHGQMDADAKNENFQDFLTGKKMVMIATKAFGMGIDIPDIAVVSHYAPTGNVCDYMQEIGRAARDKAIDGHAIYEYMSNDFQHINRLHGLSRLYKSQLVEVQKKILELFEAHRYDNKQNNRCKKRNEMLIDTESFAYIFDSPMSDDNDLVNKVKTAMLLIQKDYENRGFAPFHMRPVPIFAYGYLCMEPEVQNAINQKYRGAVVVKNKKLNVCEVNLKKIWEASYEHDMSYPKFKYMLYSGSEELDFNKKYRFTTAMSVDVDFDANATAIFDNIFAAVKEAVNSSVRNNNFVSEEDMTEVVAKSAGISKFKAESIVRVVMAAFSTYARVYSRGMNSKLFDARVLKNDVVKYRFTPASRNFLYWLEKGFKTVVAETENGSMYVVNDESNNRTREILTVLGILESFGVLRFQSLGGTNSQIYIYINATKNMRIVRDKPETYRNKLLETIADRHKISVKMLTYLFEGKFKSDEIWNLLENYFLGMVPEAIEQ